MSVGFWICLFIIELYSQKDIFKKNDFVDTFRNHRETSELADFYRMASMVLSGLNNRFLSNPFSTYDPLLCPLKFSENLWFSDVFRGYRNGKMVENRLIIKTQK